MAKEMNNCLEESWKTIVLVEVVGWRELPVDFQKNKSENQFYLIFSLAMLVQQSGLCQGNVLVTMSWEASF